MQTKESILSYLQDIMYELFELDRALITPQARLEDLDIDSIDAVDMMVKLKDLTEKRIQPDAFKHVRTVGDVVDAVYNLVNETAAGEQN
jgi:acyl carrier protein